MVLLVAHVNETVATTVAPLVPLTLTWRYTTVKSADNDVGEGHILRLTRDGARVLSSAGVVISSVRRDPDHDQIRFVLAPPLLPTEIAVSIPGKRPATAVRHPQDGYTDCQLAAMMLADAEMALITATLALAVPGFDIIDVGGVIIAAAYYAYVETLWANACNIANVYAY